MVKRLSILINLSDDGVLLSGSVFYVWWENVVLQDEQDGN